MNQQQMSPNPVSPYSHSPYTSNSPYATSPQGQYLNIPPTPATTQAPQPFHQPQPFQHHHVINQQQSRQSSMPPPKVPYSKTQETAELEKDPRGADINQISDVLSGAGVDLRAEEENLLSNYRQSGASFGNATNSQGSTISPNNSFGQWPHGTTLHGAFQGTGPLSQPVSEKDIEAELNRKHEAAARALAEAQQHHLNDPFLQAQAVRNKLASKAYEHGIGINVEGLFDKIAQTPQNTTRSVLSGPNDEAVGLARADSILNRDAPMVDVITLISLATQERLRGILEDTVAMSRIRQTTADGVVPPAWADIAVGKGPTKPTTVVPTNITKTAWEGPDSAISPMTVPGQKGREKSINAVSRIANPYSRTAIAHSTDRSASYPAVYCFYPEQRYYQCPETESSIRSQIRGGAYCKATEAPASQQCGLRRFTGRCNPCYAHSRAYDQERARPNE